MTKKDFERSLCELEEKRNTPEWNSDDNASYINIKHIIENWDERSLSFKDKVDEILSDFSRELRCASSALYRAYDNMSTSDETNVLEVAEQYHNSRYGEYPLEELRCRYSSGRFSTIQPSNCSNKSGSGNRSRCNSHHVFEEDIVKNFSYLKNAMGNGEFADQVVPITIELIENLSLLVKAWNYDQTISHLIDIIEWKKQNQTLEDDPARTDDLHVLYRFFDKSGTLLYVGLTANPGSRIKQHMREKQWWREVASTTYEHFCTREDLKTAEVKAIHSESPKYNVVHNSSRIA